MLSIGSQLCVVTLRVLAGLTVFSNSDQPHPSITMTAKTNERTTTTPPQQQQQQQQQQTELAN
jgi:hypothetical protein